MSPRRFIKLVALYLGLLVVLFTHAGNPDESQSTSKVHFEYQQF